MSISIKIIENGSDRLYSIPRGIVRLWGIVGYRGDRGDCVFRYCALISPHRHTYIRARIGS